MIDGPNTSFHADQFTAATHDVTDRVQAAAARTGTPFTETHESAPADADPLVTWFTSTYLAFLERGHSQCQHLSPDAPQPQRWDSAAPDEVVCEALCVSTGRDLQLRTRGLLPSPCARCRLAEATTYLRIGFGNTILIGRVCSPCMTTYSPSGGEAA